MMRSRGCLVNPALQPVAGTDSPGDEFSRKTNYNFLLEGLRTEKTCTKDVWRAATEVINGGKCDGMASLVARMS